MTKNSEHPLALPVGTELVGDYVITKVLGAGGFGITYEANERSLDRTVAIKEYFPVDIVERNGWALVKARSNTLEIKYARGLRRFIEEAKAITQFNHPNIVRVLRYFKTNNTAFMVLHYEEGVDMGSWREDLKSPPTEKQLVGIVQPLLDALELIHNNDFLHRDVAPDNIIIRKDGSPILIDFGSARSELTFNSKTVSALVKSGYSPFEQYAKNSKEQGPWTDIYSFGATLYQMVTGEAPPDSLSRLADDDMIPAQKRSKRYFSRDFLAAIDSALMIKISDRPQSISEWRAMLFPNQLDHNQSGGSHTTSNQGTTKNTGSPALFRSHQPGSFLDKAGQSSVASLIKKAGLRPADIGENAARLAAKVKVPLFNFSRSINPKDDTGHKGKNGQAFPSRPSNQEENSETAGPRSLRSLLDELNHRYKDAGHEQAIENAAHQDSEGGDPKSKTPEGQASVPSRIKGQKIWKSVKEKIKTIRRPFWLSRSFLSGLLLLGLLGGGIGYYGPDLFHIVRQVELPQVIKGPAELFIDNKPDLINTIDAHDGGVTTLRLLNGGRQLISTGSDRIIKIWDMKTGTLFQSFEAHDQTITALDVKGTNLIQADDQGHVTLYDLTNTQQLASFTALDGPIRSIAFVGSGNNLITGGDLGQLDYWDYKGGQYTHREVRGEEHTNSILAIISHRRFFITGSADHSSKIWGRSRRKLIRTYRGHTEPVNALALSPKAYRLATGSLDDTIKIWSPRARRARRTIQAGQGGILSLAFAKNGRWLASGGRDHSIKIWNARNGRLLHTYKGHNGAVRALVFSADEKRLISAGDDEKIRFWDWSTRGKKN